MKKEFHYAILEGYGFCLFFVALSCLAALIWCHFSAKLYPVFLPLAVLLIWCVCKTAKRRRFYTDLMKQLEEAENTQVQEKRDKIIRACLDKMALSKAAEDRLTNNFFRRTLACRDEDHAKSVSETTDRLRYVEQWIHDMKNPLAAIRLVCENNPSPVAISVLKEVDVAEGYVAKSLSASKYLAADTLYNPRPIYLKDMINGVIIRNKSRLIPLHIRINIHDVDVSVNWEAKWLEMILNQMVQNSINYRGNIDSEIEIYTEQRMGKLCLVVADNGIGIPEEDLDRIFEENYSGANAVKNEQSTGVGLYLAMLLAKKGNAILTAESVLGEWTRMYIMFPNN